jgi:hypothetical protein
MKAKKSLFCTVTFMICTVHNVLSLRSNQEEWDGRGTWHAWGERRVACGVSWINLSEGNKLGNLDIDGRIVLK